MIVEFIKTRGTEACRIGSTETEITRGIHQRGLRCQMVLECLVMRQAQSYGSRKVFEEFLFVLGIGCQTVDMLIDIARGCRQIILAPVGPEDGRSVFQESENGFHLAVHHALFLRLHIVAHGIALRSHIVLLAIAETVNGEIRLKRVLRRKLIDTADVPAETLVAHLVVGTARDVRTCLRSVRLLI